MSVHVEPDGMSMPLRPSYPRLKPVGASMSKPGEMVQILREDYENILEQYRLLRNKFLIAVPGMNLDKERDFYNFWKSDLNLSSIIDSYRKPTPSAEPARDIEREGWEKSVAWCKARAEKAEAEAKEARKECAEKAVLCVHRQLEGVLVAIDYDDLRAALDARKEADHADA